MLSRRKFLLAAMAVPAVAKALAACAPPPTTPTTTWSSLGLSGNVTIDEPVLLDQNASVSSLTITPNGVLVFDPAKTLTLQSSGNVIVRGQLAMRPESPAKVHTLRFVNVNEAAFVGGGLNPIGSDVGLWVMDLGLLNTAGSLKGQWANAFGALNAGQSTVAFGAQQNGWAIGDELVICGNRNSPDEAEVRTITSNSPAHVYGLSAPLSFPHPKYPAVIANFGTEVGNLTRNVRIEGTPGHRAHVFIRSAAKQSIYFTAFRWLGPQKNGATVLGRYPLHFHECGNGSRGSDVNGCVVRDSGGHAYVPHVSHGILIRNCIAHDIEAPAYWWDLGHATNDITYDRCLCSNVRPTEDFDYKSTGFEQGAGSNMTAVNCVATGVSGPDAAGWRWDANEEAVWNHHDNRTHSCAQGIVAWQNDNLPHLIERHSVHACGTAVNHGAYGNSYIYRDCKFIGGTFHDQAVNAGPSVPAGNPDGLRFQNCLFDGAVLEFPDGRPVTPWGYTTVDACTFQNYSGPAVVMYPAGGEGNGPGTANKVRVQGSTFTGQHLAKLPGCAASAILVEA